MNHFCPKPICDKDRKIFFGIANFSLARIGQPDEHFRKVSGSFVVNRFVYHFQGF